MDYLLLKSKVRFNGVAIIAERAYMFALPSNKKDCVVNGMFIANAESRDFGSFKFNAYVGKQKIMSTDWLSPDITTINLKRADRTPDWKEYIKKKSKKFDPKDVKMLIKAIQHDLKEVLKIWDDVHKSKKK